MMVVAPEALARDFRVNETGLGAVIMKISGVNSANAVVTGQTTHRLAREYCERDPHGITRQRGGKLTIEECMAQAMRERTRHRAVANCPERRITTTSNETFVLVSVKDGEGVWTGNGQSLDSLNYASSVGRVADAQFKLLCPKFFTAPTSTANSTTETGRAALPGDDAFLGEWDMFPTYCRRQNESDGRVRISTTTLEFADANCTIQNVTETGEGRWQISGKCDSEDENVLATYFLSIVGNKMIVRDGSEIGSSRVYHRCESSPLLDGETRTLPTKVLDR